jgi:hypothetical protein
MPRQRLQTYVVLFCDEWHIPEPAYYWLDEVRGKNPNDAAKRNLARVLKRVREILFIRKGEIADYKLEKGLYILPVEHWVSAKEAYWQLSSTS